MRGLIAAALTLLLCGTLEAAESAPPDVRMLFDVSGSMKRNDPNRLSDSALELMVTLLPEGARGGLWTFGSRVANPLPSATIDADWRQRALALKPALSDYQQYTDIEQAVRETASAAPADGKRHLILLTDGMIDIPGGGDERGRNEASRQRLMKQLAPTLADESVVVHTIAFSSGVDSSLLAGVSRETGGLYAVAEDPAALLRAFLDVFDRIFPRDQVPLDAQSFPIDERVDAFSALLFHDPDSPEPALIGPDGTRHTLEEHSPAIRWQHQPRFDIIRVPQPQAGKWRIEGDVGPDSRISIESDLALRVAQLPTTLYQGFETPIEASLNQPDAATDAPPGLEMRAELRDIDGRVRQSVVLERDGDSYRGVLAPPRKVGNARLAVVAKGDRFIRERRQAVNVLAPISAKLDEAAGSVALRAEHPLLNSDNTRIAATLQGESLTVRTQGDKRWRVVLPAIDESLSLALTLTANVTLDGDTRTIELPPVMLNPEADTGLRGVSLDRPEAEALEEAKPDQQPAASGSSLDALGDELGQWLAALPARLESLWEKAPTSLQQAARETRRNPLWWLLAALIVLLLLWRRRRNARRRRHRRRGARRHHAEREEPHV
ncbi:VWA domain-containing protein [Modicisalibacter zincidurans]|uniref:VWFA domain-containing protein n=1 Tax=Modicisalibacter zincidurans TaxID=1178777 RepID=A0ABP9RAG9_9GAMM|nr:vWA domain-containing protein [Halomonas zincidurans]